MDYGKAYYTYWKLVMKMWWRDNFKNWLGAAGTIVTFGLLIALAIGANLEPYVWWILGIIGTILFSPLLFWIPYRMWKEAQESPDIMLEQRKNPKQYISPYIRKVSASPIIDAKSNFLSLDVCFPSALIYELELMKIRAYITIDGGKTEEQEENPIKIIKQSVTTISDLHMPLGDDQIIYVRNHVDLCTPIKISLHIDAWDKDNNFYDWTTEEWTTLLLTKLN